MFYKRNPKKYYNFESWSLIQISRATTFSKSSFHVCPPKIDKYGFFVSETLKIMRMVTTWGHKTDPKYPFKKSKKFSEK